MKTNKNVDIHADDYGFSINTSKEILDCIKAGKLDSISIICNTNAFEKSMNLLYKEIPNLEFLPKLSIHLNLVEGYNLSKSSLLSINDINTSSWGDLFIGSLGGMKNKLKEELKKEIRAQIVKTSKVIEKCINIAKENGVKCEQKGLRIDSHVHTHPIPLVFDALSEVIEEEHLNVEYIRNSKEPLLPYLKHPSLWFTYPIVNFMKNGILNIFSFKIDKYCELHNIKKMYLWGLVMSESMDINRVNILYKDMINYADKHNRTIELLFHPGIALEDEYHEEFKKEYFKNANLNINRKIEKEAVLKINK